MELIEEFKREIKKKEIKQVERRREKKERELNPEIEVFKRSELLGKYTVKILFG